MIGMTRVAALDCGTNSVRLLVADADGGALTDVLRRMEITRLGQGVDATGRLSAAALERTAAVLGDYASQVRELDVRRIRLVATSATRDAANREEFAALVRQLLGIEPEVISGAEEAALSFAGAVAGLPADPPYLVCDIGGGSTELVLGAVPTTSLRSSLVPRSMLTQPATGRSVIAAHSMDIGCVRMTERHLRDDPPTDAQVKGAREDIRQALQAAATDVPVADAAAFVGVAGTVTTVAAIALDLPAYDPQAIHGSVVDYERVDEITDRLLAMPRSERAALPVMHPGRVDVIGGGALILRTVMEFIGARQVIASEHDILDGIALSLLTG
jgi:exopolyphosphatase/guanosine-5'-triphosphate,3'-diphosphate pyrophosphatase